MPGHPGSRGVHHPRRFPPPQRWLPLIVLLWLASFLRVHVLDQTPPGLYHDEAFYALDAQHVLHDGHLALFFTGNNGREPLHIYLLAGAMALFGERVWTLRLVSAYSGLLAIPLIYRLGRSLLRGTAPNADWAGLLAAAALATSYWHVNFSRVAFRAIHLVPLSVLAVWLLWRGVRKRSLRLYALAGLVLGASLYTYLSARLLPLVFVGLAGAQFIGARPFSRPALQAALRRPLVAGSLIALSIAALVCLPLETYFLIHPQQFVQRSEGLAIVGAHRATAQGQPAPTLGSNLLAVARMFVDQGDTQPRHNLPGRPAVDVLGVLGFWIGLISAVMSFQRPRSQLLLLWLGLMLLPTLLSIEAPHFLRAIGALPPVCLLVADGLTRLGQRLASIRPRLTPAVGPALVAGLTLFSGALTYRDYFGTWARRPDTAAAFDVQSYTLAQRAIALSERERVVLPQEIYSQPTALFLLEPVFEHLAPIDRQGADQGPAVLLAARGTPLRSVVVLRRAAGRPGEAWITRPLDPAVVAALWQLPARAQVYDAAGQAQAEERAGVERFLPATAQPEHALDVEFAHTLRLRGYDLEPASVAPGQVVDLELYWESLRWAPEDYVVFTQLQTPAGENVSQRDSQPVSGIYPTTLWQPGNLVTDHYTLTVPTGAQPGKYRVVTGVYQQGTIARLPASGAEQPLGDEVVTGLLTVPDPAFDPNAIPLHSTILAGNPPLLELLGYEVAPSRATPGASVAVTLYWQALRPIALDYNVFVHVLDEQDQIQAQQDGQPLEGRAPTSWWSPGETFRDVHVVPLAPDLAAGQYTVSFGLYDWATGERLPLFDSAGQRLADDRLVLPDSLVLSKVAP